MNLELQLQSLIFSLVFGMYFALMFNLFYKQLFKGKTVFKVITNFVFVMMHIILYFYLLKIVNNGILHVYFVLMVMLGFVIGNYNTKGIRKYYLDGKL